MLRPDESGVYPNEIGGQLPCILSGQLFVTNGVRSFPTMRLGHYVLVVSIALSLALPAAAASTTHSRRHPTTSRAIAKPSSKTRLKSVSKTSSKSGKRGVKPKSRIIGQRAIDDGRATQIQSALIKAGYLSGEPSGHWDSQSEAAMQKLQGDNGWQTKLVPDSRALIKLGLGPTNPGESLASPPAVGGASASTTDQ
jgi:Putative peptidoglycan binding domain